MFTMMLPTEMAKEFQRLFDDERPASGTLPARSYALSKMLLTRRQRLCELLNGRETDNDPDCDYRSQSNAEVVDLTAELTLLLIERGA